MRSFVSSNATPPSNRSNRSIAMKSIKPFLFAISAIFGLIVAGCDTVGNENEDAPAAGVFVVNQGNFGDANGSVSVYDPVAQHTRTAAISNLGSILQSATLVGDRLYLMANTGERIDIFDVETLEQTGQITDVISPRYMVTRGQKGYVTNLYGAAGIFSGGNVTVIDLEQNQKLKEIEVGNNPEGLAIVGDRLYVANFGFGEDSTVSVIDLNSEEVIDTLDADCDGPRFLLPDKDDEIFVFCTGRTIFDENFEPIGETDGAVRVLKASTGEILLRIDIEGRIGSEGPGQDAFYSQDRGLIYVVKNQDSILVFDTNRNDLVDEIGPFDGDPIGAVAYDAELERLYLGRVAGFVASGAVTIHADDGTEIDRFTAGIAPVHIMFSATDD